MERRYFDFITKDMPENSVKRACYVVREYLRCSRVTGNGESKVLICNEDICAVTLEEYLEASKILLAYSYENSDEKTIQELFSCESDCCRNNGLSGFCEGEFSLSSSKTKKICKKYADSYNL